MCSNRRKSLLTGCWKTSGCRRNLSSAAFFWIPAWLWASPRIGHWWKGSERQEGAGNWNHSRVCTGLYEDHRLFKWKTGRRGASWCHQQFLPTRTVCKMIAALRKKSLIPGRIERSETDAQRTRKELAQPLIWRVSPPAMNQNPEPRSANLQVTPTARFRLTWTGSSHVERMST